MEGFYQLSVQALGDDTTAVIFHRTAISVQNMGTLQRSLDAYFQPELMEGDCAYECEAVGRRVPAIKRTLIERLPHTFVIHLKRFEYVYTVGTRVKISERFEFPAKLNMRKYTPEGQAPPVATAATRGAGDAPPESYYAYELKGVVVHAGNAFAGHYYSFVKVRLVLCIYFGVCSARRAGARRRRRLALLRRHDGHTLGPEQHGRRLLRRPLRRRRPGEEQLSVHANLRAPRRVRAGPHLPRAAAAAGGARDVAPYRHERQRRRRRAGGGAGAARGAVRHAAAALRPDHAGALPILPAAPLCWPAAVFTTEGYDHKTPVHTSLVLRLALPPASAQAPLACRTTCGWRRHLTTQGDAHKNTKSHFI